ncbi:hypothetical protein DUNSADRAFT_5186 [Dunaliella salina]|uniref:RecF/RecN/SMC N-terminal domain-containing protein n=1 Tax=Dunaliella salina TaxID=3046 RepID=A0ABQ7GQX2_DUNSA|nr:hypothetical protein DUNSADRAFT_5186 [Dunaliella salina]|eukprot:KAF5836957.1 hypothetical protein DUNSADRAFT_5186 [Dunaliella salina]
MSELQGAREALRDIKTNVVKLRQLIASDDHKLASLERAGHIHQAIQEVSCSLAHCYKQQQAAAIVRAADAEAEVAALQDNLGSLKEQLQILESKERAASMASSNVRGKGSKVGESSVLAVLKEQVVLEEQVKQAEARLRAAQQHAAEYAQNTAELQRLHLMSQAQAQGVHNLESRTEELRAQVAEAEIAQGGTDLQDLLASTQDLLAMSHTALEESRSAQRQKEARLEQLKADLQASEAELQRQEQHLGVLNASKPAAMASIPKLRAQLERNQDQAQALQTSYQETQVRTQVLQASLGGLSPSFPSTPHHRSQASPLAARAAAPAIRRLHELFEFKPCASGNESETSANKAPETGRKREQQQQQQQSITHLCTALSVVAGSSLHVLVVPDSSSANHILSDPRATLRDTAMLQEKKQDSRVLRIWPLDRITCRDITDLQRRAQAEMGTGRVILPMDLLDFKPEHKTVMLRAFGASVIALDDTTAAELASKYGLSSVTPAGTVSKCGTVSGGFQGWGSSSESHTEALLKQKVELAEAKALGRAQASKLKETRDEAGSLEAQIASALCSIEQAQSQQEAVADAKKALHQLRAQADGEQESSHVVRTQVQHAQADMERYSNLLSNYQQLAKAGSADAAVLEQQMAMKAENEQALQTAEAELKALQQQNQATLAKQQLLQERQHALILLLGASAAQPSDNTLSDDSSAQRAADLRLEELAAALSTQQELLAAVKQRATAAEAAQQADYRLYQELEARLHEVSCKKLAVQNEEKSLVEKLVSVQEQLREQRGALKQLRKAMARLQKEFPEVLLAFNQSLQPGGSASAQGLPDADSMQKKLVALRRELDSLDIMQMSVTEHAQYTERRDSVRLFEERWAALASGADLLEAGIKESQSKVLHTHHQVSHSIGVRFEALCSMLLPGLQFRLSNSSASAMDAGGYQVESENKEDGVAIQLRGIKETSGSWSQSLEQLSGGQRTMVSLSLLLSAACEGSRSNVLLMDEVDAALDEHNQALVANLCHALAHGCLSERKGSSAGAHLVQKGNRVSKNSSCGNSHMQLICVSHHAAFQKACDALVQVSMQGNSTCVSSKLPASCTGVIWSLGKTAT